MLNAVCALKRMLFYISKTSAQDEIYVTLFSARSNGHPHFFSVDNSPPIFASVQHSHQCRMAFRLAIG